MDGPGACSIKSTSEFVPETFSHQLALKPVKCYLGNGPENLMNGLAMLSPVRTTYSSMHIIYKVKPIRKCTESPLEQFLQKVPYLDSEETILLRSRHGKSRFSSSTSSTSISV
jgi:hypothetical protein